MNVLRALHHRSRPLMVGMTARSGGQGYAFPRRLLLSSLLLLLAQGVARSAAPGIDIVVDAGAHARHDTTVSFPLPQGKIHGLWRLTGEGCSSSAEVDDRGVAHAVLPDLAPGERRQFHMTVDPTPLPAAIEARDTGDILRCSMAGHELCTYQGGAGDCPEGYDPALRRGGYLSRLLTPAGVLVTDDYPPNHRHHHGVWFSWTKTTFAGRTPDFWNMGERTGTVEAVSRGPVWSGALWAGFQAVHRYRDLGITPAVTVLDETWDLTLEAPHGAHPVQVIDLVINQRCASDVPLVLPLYRYGGLGFRGNRGWDGADNLIVLTSEGKTRIEANETRCRWCWVGGRVDGRIAGVAILCHPANVRSPQPIRVHPTEPFVCFAPSQLGEWSVAPGAALTLRYRIIVGDGEADADDLNRRWSDWAEPPAIEVVP